MRVMRDGVGDAIINAAKKKRREVADRILENKRNGKPDGKRVMRQNEILDVERSSFIQLLVQLWECDHIESEECERPRMTTSD